MTQITSFDQLDLIKPILKALKEENYTEPTPIQAAAIPHLLTGGDILGCAQTGTGKTAAFAIPIIQNIVLKNEQSKGKPRNKKGQTKALVFTPTRELAIQIRENFDKYASSTDLTHAVIYGGVKQGKQVKAMASGVDVLIATPGRLLDLIGQGYVDLTTLEMFVLDEADRMLDMGFIRDINKVIKIIPKKRQTLFFSATMPKEVAKLADGILKNPKKIEITPVSTTAELIDDKLMFVEKPQKKALLLELFKKHDMKRVIIFTRTKHGANRLTKQLNERRISAEAIHGNKSQATRQNTLKKFATGKLSVLVATDIMARGIDVDNVTHVINFDLPSEAESYVHRIGRTARAGTSGIAFSFCDKSELDLLVDVERILKRSIEVISDHSFHSSDAEEQYAKVKSSKGRSGAGKAKSGSGRGRGNSNRRGPSKGGENKSGSKGKSNSSRPPRRGNSSGQKRNGNSSSQGASKSNRARRKVNSR